MSPLLAEPDDVARRVEKGAVTDAVVLVRRFLQHFGTGSAHVLEGSVVMQVKGGKEVTLTPGQTFYEGPNDIHTVGRNASTSQPAKFLVVLIKKKKAEVLELVK